MEGQETRTGVDSGPFRIGRDGGILLAIALFMTVLNVFKPISVDDSIYYWYARQIAANPSDPYGFQVLGNDANGTLAPPVALYWWALGMRLFGHNVVAWKLWLLPFCLLFAGAVFTLGRRFARGMEWFLTFLVCLSPVFLPCLNLMLDIPSLALSLVSVCLFLRAWDRGSLPMAVLAGVVSGLAIQTKYTAIVAPLVMLLFALQFGKMRLALTAAAISGLLFLGWETWIAHCYGHSHFWLAFTSYPTYPHAKLDLIKALFQNLGSAMPALILFALVVLGYSARQVLVTGLIFVLGLLGIAVLPEHPLAGLGSIVRHPPGLSSIIFGGFGVMVCAVMATVARGLWGAARNLNEAPVRNCFRSVDGFLVLWLILEMAGYFVLSPHAALRRIMGMTVVTSLLLCRLGARNSPSRRGLLWASCACNLLLALFLFAVDAAYYQGQRNLAEGLAQEIHQRHPQSTIWYYGMGSFTFYGEQAGMKALANRDATPAAQDWVLVLEFFEDQFAATPSAARCVCRGYREWDLAGPLRTHVQAGGAVVTHVEGRPTPRVALFQVQ